MDRIMFGKIDSLWILIDVVGLNGLGYAYPNPFNPTTSIRIQSESILPNIILSIFNVNGQLIQTLEKGATNAHSMDLKWDGSRNSSGVYFIKIAWPGGSRTQKITLLN